MHEREQELEEARRKPCPGCLLYHQTVPGSVESIRKLGLIGYRGVDSLILRSGETDEMTRAIEKADAYLQHNGLCGHNGAVFFYNDPSMIRKQEPYVVIDMRDLDSLNCRIESSIQANWEDLVACCGGWMDNECDEDEESMENLAGYYCQSFMRHPCGMDLLEIMADYPNYQPKIPEAKQVGEERQVMVYCDIPPEIIKVVMPHKEVPQ